MWFIKEKSPKCRIENQWYGDVPSTDRKGFEEQLVRQIAAIPGELWEATDSGYKAITSSNTNIEIVGHKWSNSLSSSFEYTIQVDGRLVARHLYSRTNEGRPIIFECNGYHGIASVFDNINSAWQKRTEPQRQAEHNQLMQNIHDEATRQADELKQERKDILRKL